MKKIGKCGLFLLGVIAMTCLAGCSSSDNPTTSQPLNLTKLDTQAEIDRFGAEGHTDYAEQLVIGIENQPNSSITNLDALSGLTSVKGLKIYYNDELNDISGLANLVTIGTDGLVIEENPKMTDLGGTIIIKSVNGKPSSTSVGGLSGLTSILGNAVIEMNGFMATLDGLNNLATIGGDLIIHENPSLTTLGGLSSLQSVGGNTIIIMNGIMANVNGLNNLATIGGDLTIEENPSLTTLGGLVGLQSIGGSMVIGMNLTMPNVIGPNNLTTIGGDLIIDENPSLTTLGGLSSLQSVGGNMVIAMNGIMADVIGPNNLTTIGGDLAITGNPSLSQVDGLYSLESVSGTVLVQNNALITGLSGLSLLSSVGGGLLFLQNPQLADYCGLKHLLFIGFNGTYAAVGNAVNPTLGEIAALICVN